MLKFDAGIFGGELPIGLGVVGIAVVLPGGDFVDEDLFVGNKSLFAQRECPIHFREFPVACEVQRSYWSCSHIPQFGFKFG
jgi:hypothetical protein